MTKIFYDIYQDGSRLVLTEGHDRFRSDIRQQVDG